jgi:hypothetical protein
MPKLERKIITLGLLSAFNVLIFYKPLFFRVLAEKQPAFEVTGIE